MEHVISMNRIEYNQVNDIVDNELKFDSSSSLGTSPVKDYLYVATKILREGKNSRQDLNSGLTYQRDNGDNRRTIKHNNINRYKYNLRYIKVK